LRLGPDGEGDSIALVMLDVHDGVVKQKPKRNGYMRLGRHRYIVVRNGKILARVKSDAAARLLATGRR
jgi:hypothetical protein